MVIQMDIPYWLLIGIVVGVVAGILQWLHLRSRSRQDQDR